MITYTYSKKFDSDTGEPVGVQIDEKVHRCDWTGVILDNLSGGDTVYARYQIEYGMQDPCFGAGGEEYDLSREYDLRMHILLSPFGGGEYLFRWPYEENSVVPAFKNSDFRSFDTFFRHVRVRTVRELIEKGMVEPYQIPGHRVNPEELPIEEWEEFKNS